MFHDFSTVDVTDAIIEERNKKIQELYTEMKELNGLFQLVDEHVTQQAPLIDDIATNISETKANCKEGAKQIKIADENSKRSMSMTTILIIAGTSIGTATGIIVASVLLL